MSRHGADLSALSPEDREHFEIVERVHGSKLLGTRAAEERERDRILAQRAEDASGEILETYEQAAAREGVTGTGEGGIVTTADVIRHALVRRARTPRGRSGGR